MNSFSHRYLVAGLAGVLAAFLAACTAHQKPSSVETVLATMAKDIVIPIEAEELKNPLAWDPQVESQGEQTFSHPFRPQEKQRIGHRSIQPHPIKRGAGCGISDKARGHH